MRTAFDREGDLRSTDALAGLVTLWRERVTGALHFSRSGASARLDLRDGEVVGVSSSDARFDTASILVRAGKLDAGTLERLPGPEGGDRALAALQAGILTRREWRWGEKIRAVEVVSDLLSWLAGESVLDREAQPEAGEFRLSVPRLVLELFLRSRDRSLVLHYLGGVDVPLVRTDSFDAEFATFGLTADAVSVVRLIDGEATAAEIASEAPAEAFAVEKLLAALVTLGLVEPGFAATPVPTRRAVEPPAPTTEPEEPELDRADFGAEELEAQAPAPSEPEPTAEYPLASESSDLSIEIETEASEDFRRETLDLRSISREAELETAPERVYAPPDETEPEIEIDREERSPLDTALRMSEPIPSGGGRRFPAAPWLGLFAALLVGLVIVLFLKARGPSPGAAPAVATTPAETTPAPAPTASTEAPAVAVRIPVSTLPPAPTRAATPALAPTVSQKERPAPTRAPAAVPPASVEGGSRRLWQERAERDRRRLASDRKTRFAVQLELVCELSSLADAWKHDRPEGTMWLLPVSHQGRPCFRVLWGRYATREAAQRGLARAPSFFSTQRNRPLVVPVR